MPRSSLTPILRFADVEAFVQETPAKADPTLLGFCQVGVAKEDQPHYVKLMCRADHDPSDLIEYAMGVISERRRVSWADRAVRAQPSEHGVISAVRTYESPLDRRLEERGFTALASVSLLMKETAVRVFEPALVAAATQ